MTRTHSRSAVLPLAAALLAGCAADGSAREEPVLAPTAPPEAVTWRSLATEDDRRRLRQWRSAWVRALGQARAAGHAADLAREGALLDPDAAAAWESPPPGEYRCRTVKLGAQGPGLLDYVAYPWFACRVRIENGLMSFAKLSGSQRPIGLILADTQRRMIFLGTLQLGDERRALEYGRDRERDMIGVVERIGPERWRIAFPLPHFESVTDVVELVPAA